MCTIRASPGDSPGVKASGTPASEVAEPLAKVVEEAEGKGAEAGAGQEAEQAATEPQHALGEDVKEPDKMDGNEKVKVEAPAGLGEDGLKGDPPVEYADEPTGEEVKAEVKAEPAAIEPQVPLGEDQECQGTDADEREGEKVKVEATVASGEHVVQGGLPPEDAQGLAGEEVKVGEEVMDAQEKHNGPPEGKEATEFVEGDVKVEEGHAKGDGAAEGSKEEEKNGKQNVEEANPSNRGQDPKDEKAEMPPPQGEKVSSKKRKASAPPPVEVVHEPEDTPPVVMRVAQFELRPPRRKRQRRNGEDHGNQKPGRGRGKGKGRGRGRGRGRGKGKVGEVIDLEAEDPPSRVKGKASKPQVKAAKAKARKAGKQAPAELPAESEKKEKDADRIRWTPLTKEGVAEFRPCLQPSPQESAKATPVSGVAQGHGSAQVQEVAASEEVVTRKRAKAGESDNGPSFARRVCPKTSPASKRWEMVRTIFFSHLAPYLDWYEWPKSAWEARFLASVS